MLRAHVLACCVLIFILHPSHQIHAADNGRLIIIDKASQTFEVHENGRVVRHGPVSTGQRSRWTPVGNFSVKTKERNHFSSKYRVDMPYAMQIHGNIFIHQGPLPGYPASKGCIRLGDEDAKFLFNWARLGDRVTVK